MRRRETKTKGKEKEYDERKRNLMREKERRAEDR